MEGAINLIGLLFWLGLIFFFILMWWKIMKKTGYHPALAILMFVPIANIVMMAILAFRDWPIHKQLKGEPVKPASLSGALVAVIIALALIPIIILFTAIAIPNLLRARSAANESFAEASVKTISTAIESYAAANNGKYPSSEYDLRYATPPYLTESYSNQTIHGYNYSLNLNPEGYEVVAEPAECAATGNKVFILNKSGGLTVKDCK